MPSKIKVGSFVRLKGIGSKEVYRVKITGYAKRNKNNVFPSARIFGKINGKSPEFVFKMNKYKLVK